jgi:multicomponent Na+:H+ antiporter subunit D
MRREPLLAVIMALGMMSLIGFPPSSGFFGKVGDRACGSRPRRLQIWLVLGALLVASIGTLLAMSRLWTDVFWGRPSKEMPSRGKGRTKPPVVPEDTRLRTRTLASAGALLLLSLAIFVVPGPLWELCLQAAEGLLDVTDYVETVTTS